VSDKFDFVLSLEQQIKEFLASRVSTSSMKETEQSRNGVEKDVVIMQ
jgi:hypothetical protein